MLRHPTRNIEVLNARLDVVQFCLHPNHEDAVGNMIVCLKNIKSVTVSYIFCILNLPSLILIT